MSESQYVCVMFPYPSGAGLHVGHCQNYLPIDSYCRWLNHKGVSVFQPFGYDAFGLPAENYARQVGGDPREVTMANIAAFRKQMSRMNTMYEEKLVTSEPSYYKWTQWLFMQLLRAGLAYKARGEVNYCCCCSTVLANEQVKERSCERCGTPIVMLDLDQWYFRTTAYKDRLIKNLEKLDYPEGTIKQQREWLENLRDWCVSRQRSWGCPIPVESKSVIVEPGQEEGIQETLDTFVDSSFYYLRYLEDDPYTFLRPENYRQVDLYVGGAEHACMHLIYARFIHMFLYDQGIVPVEEPFKKVIHQGMITRDGHKMGKSKGNAINPDNYDPDELRLYLMFLGHYFDGGDWSDDKIVGLRRFLGRMKRWLCSASDDGEDLGVAVLADYIDGYTMAFKFNKVVSTFMTFYNNNKHRIPNRSCARQIESMLRVFAPSFKLD